ncbi:BFH_collapsed_G0048500.mRNA.1.CDS.1 [Saccharomyces cerevisiae]|nr:BFH_HP2_G0047390.mRNA.1.CDS.1 [Saccharomyces cerevisiae]CAI6755038.1 BFH_HP2_G0047390.mRNA.1.CDS.1 [Saccharomyces cerevisiae]CAI6768400.1 BFH_HP1_G0047870.mRNA.1.CDS.1 [Saccharomyces cerevisiae]CAI7329922.1 BFH_collapsed_G0048500.mRNA.1.CDS.1 [Saccharomyces cerevisiae]
MSSDEEDFNDIYGDDKPTTTEEVKKEEEQNKAGSGTSQLDQLAALQALSSSLNKLNNPNSNNSSSNNSNQDTSSSKQDGTANDKEGSNEDTKNEKKQESATSANANANASSAGPSGLPWEQLQQTMSQFQQPSSQSPPQQQVTQTKEERSKADLSKESCKMFIGGLNWDTTEANLREYFGKYGTVTDLKIMKDPATGRSRGFGFLSFEKPSSVDEVVKTQHILDGKVIDPKRAIPRDEQDKTGKIFVGGIGPDVRPKEFEEFFSQWGTIIDAQLMLDKDTGQSRGFGFVTYDSADAVDRVCQNKFIDFKDRKIEIKRAEPRHMQQKSSNNGGNNGGNNMNRRGGNFGNQGDFNQMYQNPMMGGYNPMMNPQAMTDYYQKMQEYYQQMQKQTGMDYTQMYQQQMQQMAMMMPGFAMPPNAMTLNQPQQDSNATQGSPAPSDSDNNKSNDVQTIGNTSNTDSGSPPLNLPNGPKGPSQYNDDHNSGYGYNRDRGDRDRNDRDRDYNHRSGGNHRRNGRGGRGGYNRRNNGYHPYNR